MKKTEEKVVLASASLKYQLPDITAWVTHQVGYIQENAYYKLEITPNAAQPTLHGSLEDIIRGLEQLLPIMRETQKTLLSLNATNTTERSPTNG